MLILHGGRLRLGLLEPHLNPRDLRDDAFMPLRDQLAEQVESFGLVLVQGIALRHAAPADDLAEVIERNQMVAP